MGRKLDALLRRNSKTVKFKAMLNLAISRLSILKRQRQVRFSNAQSDVVQLLNLTQHDRALQRVEHVIKEQNMLDVLVMIEGYCNTLIERVDLLENNKECPDELKEATSSLIFAASRCGEFPELNEIRAGFTIRFGKDFTSRAAELRNTCGVNPKIVQKLSTRQPSYESRLKVLKEIASENGVKLQLEEQSPLIMQEQINLNQNVDQSPPSPLASSEKVETSNLTEDIGRNEILSGSLRAKKYRDVASAAQAAFESAADAADAARAAVELSRFGFQEFTNYDEGSPTPRSTNQLRGGGSLRSNLGSREANVEMIPPVDSFDSESESEELIKNRRIISHEEEVEEKNKDIENNKLLSDTSSDSDGDTLTNTKMHPSHLSAQTEPIEKTISFDHSDDDTRNDHRGLPWLKNNDLYINGASGSATSDLLRSTDKYQLKRLNIERRPLSVRTKRGN